MSWSTDVVLEFLELYKTEQILWYPKHPGHRNRNEVNDAWLRIQNSLSIECTVSDLKKKKESLMTSFRFHFNKKRSQETYRTSWFAYELMESFLINKYETNSKNQLETEFFETPTYKNVVSRPVHSVQQFQNKRNRDIDSSTDLAYAKKRTDEAPLTVKRTNTDNTDQDEYDLYGQLLAKKLRKLDERQRDHAMHDIDNIMFQAKMQSDSHPKATQSSRSYSTSPVPRKANSPIFISIQQQNQGHYELPLQYDGDADVQVPQ